MDKACTYAALSFIKSFNDTLKEEKNITKILIITRLDTNLNVLRLKTVPFLPLFERL